MKFGKLAAKNDYRTLRFGKYAQALPPPPAKLSQWDRVMATTADQDFGDLFPMLNNDVEGDCTIAGLGHCGSLWTGMAGTGFIPSTNDAHELYRKLTGGDDLGLMCLDVLKYAQKNPWLGADPILAYVRLNPRNHVHVKQAIQYFGGVYLGFQVQHGCIEDFQARKPWDWSYNLENAGHCVVAGAYDDTAPGYDGGLLRVATWGNWQDATWAWFDECVDEAYAVLPAQAKDPDFAPGFDIKTLTLDLLAVTG